MGVYMHHENVDGTGYPLGLHGDQIYMFAKIIHIADVYDAMTNKRSYHSEQPPKEALEFLMNRTGSMFQPEYVQAFVTYIPVYPKGRNVILSDGSVAVVVENRQKNTLYPIVRRLSDGETIDMAEVEETELFIRGFEPL
jgi:HD-GYP domain-containing protein (c-di-GMP phosphodiesterase class II)